MWIGCVMGAHETLAGGLIAAVGALFGAWLAFSAVQEQIGMERRNERVAKRLASEKTAEEAGRDLDRMKLAVGYLNSIGIEFPEPGSRVERTFTQKLLELRRAGRLQLSESAKHAPDGYGDSIVTVMSRLKTIADDLAEEIKELPADMRAQVEQGRESDVRTAVAGVRQLAELLAGKIPGYEQKFEDAVVQVSMLDDVAMIGFSLLHNRDNGTLRRGAVPGDRSRDTS
jgi:hypothetical protein